MNNGWIAVSDDMPLISQDVLIYSTSLQGYAVGFTQYNGKDVAWFNSTNGLPFPLHSVSHWRTLPAAPANSSVGSSGAFISYTRSDK